MIKDSEVKQKLVDQAIKNVIFEGWSWKAIISSARSLDIEEDSLNKFLPNGPRDLVREFVSNLDSQMLARINKLKLGKMPIRMRIYTAVKIRIELYEHYREQVRGLLSYLSFPGNITFGTRLTVKTVSTIWYGVGDVSTDFSYYTKRGLLTAIYSATLLYWLSDNSKDSEDTWSFLERRIEDVMKIPKVKAGLKDGVILKKILSMPLQIISKKA